LRRQIFDLSVGAKIHRAADRELNQRDGDHGIRHALVFTVRFEQKKRRRNRGEADEHEQQALVLFGEEIFC